MWYYNELYHHGVEGQKWGVRRYQNEDGSLTEAGRKRYGYSDLEKAARSRTDFGASYRTDRAADKRGRMAYKDSKYRDGSDKKRNMYERAAEGNRARKETYEEASKEMEAQGRMKTAIKMQAVANNNAQIAKQNQQIAKGKNAISRYWNALTSEGITKAYSATGREYMVNSEYIKNTFTMGLYTVIADRSYEKKHSAEERLAKLRDS